MTAINKNINKTVSLDSTNVRLTSNIKFVIDQKNRFWFDMIESNLTLCNSIFKAHRINEDLSYSENLRSYAEKAMNSNSLYAVQNDNFKTTDNLSSEYSQLYKYGAYNDFNDSYEEKLRFFAPFYYNTVDKPDAFLIFRTKTNSSSITDILSNGELLKIFDMRKFNSYVLDNIEQSYISSTFDESFVLEGIDLNTGMHFQKIETSLSDLLNNETTLLEYENWLTNLYKRNTSIFSNIINLEFAFSDSENTDGFSNYVGIYVKFNDITSEEANTVLSDKHFVKLIKTENSVIPYSKDYKLTEYLIDVQTSNTTARGNDDRKTIDIVFKLQPEKFTFIQVVNNGVVDFTITFNDSVLGETIEETIDNVINDINYRYDGNETTILATKIDKNRIRLTTNNVVYDDILQLVKSTNSIYIEKPLFGTNNNYEFLGPGENSFSSPYFFDLTKGSIVKVKDNSGNTIIANVIRAYKYRDIYVYDTDKQLPEKFGNSEIVFSKYVSDQPVLCSFIEHFKLDYAGTSSDYSDVLDFDEVRYKEFLIKTVNDQNYVGKAAEYFNVDVNDLTQAQILEYKNLVLNKIEQFFNTVEVKRQYLIKDINLVDFESTNIDDEYDRLDEKTNPDLVNINKLNQFINKFAALEGSDCYNNPYRFNSALPFRKDNFATSTQNQERDLRDHTLSWFILGEGKPPYYSVSDETIKKLLSYSLQPIDTNLLESDSVDEYDKLTYETDKTKMNAWSYIYYDSLQQASFSFFKGVKYRFETSDLDGYRFSVILKSTVLTDENFEVKSYRNDTFKTYTIVIYFYIPDPVLTTAENGFDYYLDRLLLYFSKEIYSTIENEIDFGIERISLDLYNNTKNKTYLNQHVTNNWYHETINGTILYVGKGDLGVFNTNFADILTINNDFEIFYRFSNDEDSVEYGMTIIFENIVEIGVNHFWCKKIKVKGNYDFDLDEIVDEIYEYDVYQEFLSNPMLFYSNNSVFISKSIAYELANYEKLLTASANNERFKDITIARIKEWFVKNSLNGLQISIVEPEYFSIGVSLKSNKKSTKISYLEQLENKYSYPVYRHITKNIPVMKPIQEYKSYLSYDNVLMYEPKSQNEYSRIITNSEKIKLDSYVTTYTRELSSNKNNSKFSYLNSNTNNEEVYIDLDWNFNPIELRNFVSLVFNSYQKIELNSVFSTKLNLTDLLFERIIKWCDLKNLNEEQKRLYSALVLSKNILKDSLIYKDENFVEKSIAKKFCEELFLKIYKLEKLSDENGKTYEFSIIGTELKLTQKISNAAISANSDELKQPQKLILTFIR